MSKFEPLRYLVKQFAYKACVEPYHGEFMYRSAEVYNIPEGYLGFESGGLSSVESLKRMVRFEMNLACLGD